MTDEQFQKLWITLRRPIHWDPVPPWVRLTKEQLIKFNEVQTRLNTKLADIQQEKMKELAKITGI